MFIRKISSEYWPDNFDCIDDIPALPITLDMRAKSNTLSVWEFEDDEIVEGALAISMNSYNRQIETIELVKLPVCKVKEAGLDIRNNSGDTFLTQYKSKHHDIENLNHKKIGQVAKLVIESIKENHVEIISQDRLLKLLDQKIKSGEIKHDDLTRKWKTQINDFTRVDINPII